jgi:lambda repressor-like predicted transcriptional regulator
MTRREWLLGLAGTALAAASLYSGTAAVRMQRALDQATAAGQANGRIAVLELEVAAQKVWEERHDADTAPMTRDWIAFAAAWPEQVRKTDLVYRYVLRHATLEELQSVPLPHDPMPNVWGPAVPARIVARRPMAHGCP